MTVSPSIFFLIFTELSLIFDQPAYSVEEGGSVDVMVTWCGMITGDVVVSVMTSGTAGTAHVVCEVSMVIIYSYISCQFG